MNSSELHEVGVRLAAALLLKDGTISLSDIEALPVVESREDALRIVSQLVRMMDIEERAERVPGRIGGWETVLRLRHPMTGQAAAYSSAGSQRTMEDPRSSN